MTICDPFTLFALPFTTDIQVVNLIAMNSSNQFVIMPAKNRFNDFLNHTATVFLTECPKPHLHHLSAYSAGAEWN